jgi:hypothetical protein
MANKYSRYELQPFPSLYVDNKQPEIAELLVNRYNQNKTSKDLIDRTLGQMELLDGDKGHLERVKGEVKGTLKDHISRGDWENSSLVVADAANMVATDAGLIASNRSMQNRQAEIAAVREARLNGISMLDFGASMRTTHQSYVYDENLKTYVTNIYEPLSETQLDYRTRKEKMVGNIPSSQGLTWAGISRGQTNKTANLLVEQYITDTNEGKQEFKKLVELDLPSTIPLEERAKMAKAQILEDFRQVAQQQEYNKVIAPAGGGGGDKDKTFKGDGTIVISNTSSSSKETGAKIQGLQISNGAAQAVLANKNSTNDQKLIAAELIRNNTILLNRHLKNVAQDDPRAKAAYDDRAKLKEAYIQKFGKVNGTALFNSNEYQLDPSQSTKFDWGGVLNNATIGMAAGATGAAAVNVIPGYGQLAYGAAAAIGFTIGAAKGILEQWNGDEQNVRSVFRNQNIDVLFIDDEKEQLMDNQFGNENANYADVNKLNKRLGTNFTKEQLPELINMSGVHFDYMTKDTEERMSGDDLYTAATNSSTFLQSQHLTFGTTPKANTQRGAVNNFIKTIDLNNAGLAFEDMSTNSKGMEDWINNDIGGMNKMILVDMTLPNVSTNTPLKLTFGSEEDGVGAHNRTAYITDPSVIQPGGWVYSLLDNNYGMAEVAYDESMRDSYSKRGYDNVNMDNYITDLTNKYYSYNNVDEQQVLAYRKSLEDDAILDMLLDPAFSFPQYEVNGTRGVKSKNGFIPFLIPNKATGQLGFNQAAWLELNQNHSSQLAALRGNMLNTRLSKMMDQDLFE